jgi:hypothetical protein
MKVAPPRTVAMRARDGVRLDADVYYPEGEGPFPALLMRQPYGRRIASTIAYAHPSWYAAHGYIVAIQDVRGRGTSEGTFRLFADDAADGADAVTWAASLPGSSGMVGMYGFSYQGTNQLLAAALAGPALKALAPAMIGWDVGRDWAYENDAFCLVAGLGWATQMAAENARLAGDCDAFDAFFAASRNLPLSEPVAARPRYMTTHGRYCHYGDWLAHPPDHDYWRGFSPAALASEVQLPMLFIGGWYDSHLPGTVAAYKHFAAVHANRTRLVVGPWLHFPWTRWVAGTDFGAEAAINIDSLQIKWFDRWLKGASDTQDQAPVRLFDLGAKQWRDFSAWPTSTTTMFLSASGRAARDDSDGLLVLAPPAHEGCEFIAHDPWRPVSAVGGAYGTPPGPADRTAVDARPDVLTFTGAPVSAPLAIAGDVAARLWLTSDAPDFDVSCTLSRVTPDGRAMTLTQGYRRVKCGADLDLPITVPMRAICITLSPGQRLRLSVAGASFPAYPVNPGTGSDPTSTPAAEAKIITLGVRHGGVFPSSLLLGGET